jgi:transposase
MRHLHFEISFYSGYRFKSWEVCVFVDSFGFSVKKRKRTF